MASGTPARVLVVDIDPATLDQARAALVPPAFTVLPAATRAEAEAVLTGGGVDAAVIGMVLPDADGRTFASDLARHASTAAIPVILLALRGAAVQGESRRLGVADVLEKPLDPARLVGSVSAALAAGRSAARRSVDHRLRVAGREAFVAAYAQASAPGATPAAVILADLDHLTAINEAYGRAAGDDAVRDIGGRLVEAFRDTDTVARWRDDEFVLLLPATDVAAARRLLARAQAALVSAPLAAPDGHDLPVTLSAGIATARPEAPLEAVLAAADRALTAAKAQGPSTVLTDGDEQRGGPVTVLVAEDDRVSATLVRHRLERAGYRVVHCLNGNDALTAAEARTFDLCILDIRMPGLDGIEVLKRIRALPGYARTPIVILTSLGREADIVRGFDLGASDYVTKPFSPVELLARIQRLVRNTDAAGRR
jgi:diguanylate cyclase (GGDEF)-like protein